MPELPEVEALRHLLATRAVGRTIAGVQLTDFSALQTYAPPLEALVGLEISRVARHGKWLAVDAQGLHLCFHLARAGWLVWRDEQPAAPARRGKGPLAFRLTLADRAGFDLTEAGTQRRLAIQLVNDPVEVPAIAGLGPDPMGPDFDQAALDAILAGAGRAQLKGVLRDQRQIAGIGNAYSDEILHAAGLSPFTPAASLDAGGRARLLAAIRSELDRAVGACVGLAASSLKDVKRDRLRVHGRTGQPCHRCGGRIAEVSFADSALQYCPGCQTGGRLLADRRMSRLLR